MFGNHAVFNFLSYFWDVDIVLVSQVACSRQLMQGIKRTMNQNQVFGVHLSDYLRQPQLVSMSAEV
jgi:hypothetical protein